MKRRALRASAILVVLTALSAVAYADLSKKVIAEFKGHILISNGPLEAAGDDKATIAEFKKANLKVVEGQDGEVKAWHFNYTAFLKKTGASEMKFEFYTDDKDAKYAADRRLAGVDATTPVLTGEIDINEDDGVTRGKTYKLKLVGTFKGKDVTVSETAITLK